MLHYTKTGKGKLQIILIHGNSSGAESWSEMVSQPNLNENFSMIAVDLPGHGSSPRSTQPETDYSLLGMARHVKELVDSLSGEKYVLVGNSLGANVIGEIAPTFVNCAGIMLIGSSALGKGLQITEIMQPNPNVGACFNPAPAEAEIDALVDDAVHQASEAVKEKIKNIFKQTDPAVRSAIAACVGRLEFSDELSNIEKSGLPLAVVFGAEEKFCIIDHLDKTDLKKWRDKTILIPGSGHFPQLDQPVALSKVIGEFATEVFGSRQSA